MILRKLFSIDLRSLALFRICLGIILLIDLYVRSSDLTAHYSDFGVLPREAWQSKAYLWSIHYLSGSWQWEGFLFIIAAVFALMFLVGYKTWWANLVSWYFLCSLHARNPLILQSGDILLKLLLFWSLFLPLGERLSIDYKKNLTIRKAFSMGTVAILLQVCFVYWFSIFFKWNADWLEGRSIAYALNIDQFVTPLGQWIRNYPQILKYMTFSVLWVELIVPFLAFIPFYTDKIRIVVVATMMFLHLSFGFFLELGLFPYISMVSWIVFIPSFVWEKQSIESKEYLGLTKSGNFVATILIISIFFWNLPSTMFKDSVHAITRVFRIRQKWNMFSRPLRNDGWYILAAELENGDRVDLFQNGAPLSWEKPKLVSGTYKNQRWRKYHMNLSNARNKKYLPYYGDYLCYSWNTKNKPEHRIRILEIIYMLERTNQDQSTSEPKKIILWTHACS